MNRILGIDYGERRVGLAISDPLNIFAKPFSTIDRKSNTDYIQDLLKIIDENGIKEIVVGLPLNMKGVDSKQTTIVRNFVQELKSKTNHPIYFQDERLSSKIDLKTWHFTLVLA